MSLTSVSGRNISVFIRTAGIRSEEPRRRAAGWRKISHGTTNKSPLKRTRCALKDLLKILSLVLKVLRRQFSPLCLWNCTCSNLIGSSGALFQVLWLIVHCPCCGQTHSETLCGGRDWTGEETVRLFSHTEEPLWKAKRAEKKTWPQTSGLFRIKLARVSYFFFSFCGEGWKTRMQICQPTR